MSGIQANGQNSTLASTYENTSNSGNSTSTERDSKGNANATSDANDDDLQATTNSQNATLTGNSTSTSGEAPKVAIQNATGLVKISGEPLLPAEKSITREYSIPVLEFEGELAAEIKVIITWSPDGTTEISDSRGYSYALRTPANQGNVSLFQNSTVIDQKIVGSDLQYDIYWRPVKDAGGITESYKFTIVGTSSKNSSMVSLALDGGKYFGSEADRYVVTQPIQNSVDRTQEVRNSEELKVGEDDVEGLELDWSDAISAGYENIKFDSEKSTLDIPVGKSFLIDPTIVTTISVLLSPTSNDYFDGQKRLATIRDNGGTERLHLFYYDGSNIVYRTSDDEGETWSSTPISLGTGVLAADSNRWTLITSRDFDDTQYVHIFYWVPSGSNMLVKSIRGNATGLTVTWGSPVTISTIPSSTGCGSGSACGSVAAAADYNGNLYAALRWKLTTGQYTFEIKKSPDFGLNWTSSLPQVGNLGTVKPAITLTPLPDAGMLVAHATYGSPDLKYRIFNGSSWTLEQSQTNTGMSADVVKQLSSATSQNGQGYVAFTNVTTTLGGILKVATFFENGTFKSIETAEDTLRHKLPSIMVNANDDINIHSLASNVIYNTRRSTDLGWETPFTPYGTSFSSPNSLTASNELHDEHSAVWREGTASPYNVMFAYYENIIAESNTKVSPTLTDYYEGERRVLGTFNRTLFAFYYDGSNIVYKSSLDDGHTWSIDAVSTGTGQLASDNYRWTLVHLHEPGNERVTLLYYKISGSNTNFYAKTFSINGRTLELISTDNLFSAANDASCNPTGTCAAATGAVDSNSTIYSAFRWKSSGIWHYRIFNSTDGGETWLTSLGTKDVTTTSNPIVVSLTSLSSGKMLFSYLTYEDNKLFYELFNGQTWTLHNVSSTGMSANTVKQISSASADPSIYGNSSVAYVSYLTGGTSGTLKIATFFGNGTFLNTETADSTLNHWLPSIAFSNEVAHVYSLANGIIYDTQKNITATTGWEVPTAPYGDDYYSANQLTSQGFGLDSIGVMWSSGSSPYTLHYSGSNAGTVGGSSGKNSPTKYSEFDGQKRVLRVSGSQLFAFYYTTGHISYKYSNDNGKTWSSTPVSLGTGKISKDSFRWTIIANNKPDFTAKYVTILYHKQLGTDTKFYAKTLEIVGTSLNLLYTKNLFTVPNSAACDLDLTDVCGAETTSLDSSGNMYVAINYNDASTSTYKYRIMKSSNYGSSWQTSLAATDSSSSGRLSMALTKLASGSMLFAFAPEGSTTIYYKVLNTGSGIWEDKPAITDTGMTATIAKQLSAASDSTGKPYLAFIAKKATGTYVRVVEWTNQGLSPVIATPDNSKLGRLPTVMIHPDDTTAIYSISSNGDILKMDRVEGIWIPGYLPYGTSSPDAEQLAGGVGVFNLYPPVIWRESTNLREAGVGFFRVTKPAFCGHVAKAATPCTGGDIFFSGEFSYTSPFGSLNEYDCNPSWCAKFPHRVTYSPFHPSSRDYLINEFGSSFSISFGPIQNPFRVHEQQFLTNAAGVSTFQVENMIVLASTTHFHTFIYQKDSDVRIVDFVVLIQAGYSA